MSNEMTKCTHSEDYCRRCGCRHHFNFTARSKIWNLVMKDKESIVCINCFLDSCEEKGVMAEFILFYGPLFSAVELTRRRRKDEAE